jgi:hypothetical protein
MVSVREKNVFKEGKVLPSLNVHGRHGKVTGFRWRGKGKGKTGRRKMIQTRFAESWAL